MARSITEIKVTHRADGEGFRRVGIEWRDESGDRHQRLYCGFTATKIFNDLETSTAIGEEAREGFLLGLARGLSVEAYV
jgi:hypothetical protein